MTTRGRHEVGNHFNDAFYLIDEVIFRFISLTLRGFNRQNTKR